MKPSAALLIDLENFYRSRLDHFHNAGVRPESRPSLGDDLAVLVRHARRAVGLPFAVTRAYADFHALGAGPQEVMRQGVEPVQVFRLSGRAASKNAADMKLAMDAVALLCDGGHVEHVVLVSGDADFIPVVLELKRRGAAVSVVAVSGATSELLPRFVDQFELFEALEQADADVGEGRAPADHRPLTPLSPSGSTKVKLAQAGDPGAAPHTPEHYRRLL
ncbi:MAG: NYN domain-containing protein, partial [Gemmataceae bacterium]|nr:NYN domain-containing protein [Gemmataceae bacterium]